MGAWGANLYQDDVALDIKDEYKDNLRRGKTNEEEMCVCITFCSDGNDHVCRMRKQGSGVSR